MSPMIKVAPRGRTLFEPPQRQNRGYISPLIPHKYPTPPPLSQPPADPCRDQSQLGNVGSASELRQGLKRFQNFESSMLKGLGTARMEESGAFQIPSPRCKRVLTPLEEGFQRGSAMRRPLSISSRSKDRDALSPSGVRARGAQCLALQC